MNENDDPLANLPIFEDSNGFYIERNNSKCHVRILTLNGVKYHYKNGTFPPGKPTLIHAQKLQEAIYVYSSNPEPLTSEQVRFFTGAPKPSDFPTLYAVKKRTMSLGIFIVVVFVVSLTWAINTFPIPFFSQTSDTHQPNK